MIVGIPRGLMYFKYAQFFHTFFKSMKAEIYLSEPTDSKILRSGTTNCTDDACLPMKVYMGHIISLKDKCNLIAVPRIFKCEYGESLCPKMRGLPELMGAAEKKSAAGCRLADAQDTEYRDNTYIMTKRIDISDPDKSARLLAHEFKRYGVPHTVTKYAYYRALKAQSAAYSKYLSTSARSFGLGIAYGYNDEGFKKKVFLAGHSYIVHDSFINMNIADKLHAYGVGIITEEYVSRKDKDIQLRNLDKKPYWSFFSEICGAGRHLLSKKAIDGIIYLSSFSCGTDDYTVEMLRSEMADIPFLVLKLDEQTGEAGFDTRLEAFCDVLGV